MKAENGNTNITAEELVIFCRSVRIGSCCMFPANHSGHIPVLMSSEGFKFKVPALNGASEVPIVLTDPDFEQILYYFDERLQVLYVFPSSACGERIREQLHMTPGDTLYFDPNSEKEYCKIITFLIDTISDEAKSFLRNTFHGKCLLKEVHPSVADTILVFSTPPNKKRIFLPAAQAHQVENV